MNSNHNYFEQKKVFKSEIQPLIESIKKICAINRIPFFVGIAVANSAEKTTYKYDGVLTGYLNLQLTDDKFTKHLCVANGFDVKPKGTTTDFKEVSDFLADNPPPEFDDIIEAFDSEDE